MNLKCSDALNYFLKGDINQSSFDVETLKTFSYLDDYDLVSALKDWQFHKDFVLSNLCDMIINRDLLRIKFRNKPIKRSELKTHETELIEKYDISKNEAEYFVFDGKITNQAYQNNKEHIKILYKSGKIKDIVKASDQLSSKAFSKPITKYYICYPKKKM